MSPKIVHLIAAARPNSMKVAKQTGRTMIAYEAVCGRERPAAIVVVGETAW